MVFWSKSVFSDENLSKNIYDFFACLSKSEDIFFITITKKFHPKKSFGDFFDNKGNSKKNSCK